MSHLSRDTTRALYPAESDGVIPFDFAWSTPLLGAPASQIGSSNNSAP